MSSAICENSDSSATSQNECSPNTSSHSQTGASTQLTQDQINRMENNRKRALSIREAKEKGAKIAKMVIKGSDQKKLLDSGAGFFIDEEELIEEKRKEANIVYEPPVPIPDEHLLCEKCESTFPHSFLSLKFELNVCDGCRNKYPDDYKLITKTDAKAEFLLKDCDFDFREPPLKFMLKKNPHKSRNDMKLFLYCQVKQRAVDVHETMEEIEEKKEQRVVNLHNTRQRTYEKKLEVLRKEARKGSKKLTAFHQHEYSEGVYNEEEDNYFKICKTCDHRLEYEEL